FFFFQAEDGIRDPLVTGVQTCALPIYSGYVTTPEQRARQARVHARQPDGALVPQPLEAPPVLGEFWSGGGPLYSTARDYLAFLQMLLYGGTLNAAHILKAETVALMHRNAIGDISAGVMKAQLANLPNDVDFFPCAQL